MESLKGGDGVREYIGVLRLLEKHKMPQLRRAVDKALECGVYTRDAIALFLCPQEEARSQTFNLDGYPHLKHVIIQAPNLRVYAQLIGGAM